MNAAPRKQRALRHIQALYAWRPALYHATGSALRQLQPAGAEQPRFAYQSRDLLRLAKEAGISKPGAKRAPALLYLCVQLARDVPTAELALYKQHGLLVDHIRMVLGALDRHRQPEDQKRVRARIRERLQQHGTRGFKTFIRHL